MNAIRIRRKLESDTLHLPELQPFVGKAVEIIVLEDSGDRGLEPAGLIPGTGDWKAVLEAAQHLKDYDYQAQVDQDVCDIRDAEERFR
jgi:hypothetical protein